MPSKNGDPTACDLMRWFALQGVATSAPSYAPVAGQIAPTRAGSPAGAVHW
jgi:hypothetical protein